MYRTLCTLFKNRSLNTRLLYLCKFRKNTLWCDLSFIHSRTMLMKNNILLKLKPTKQERFFHSICKFTTLYHCDTSRFHILECMNQWENKQFFTIFIFENVFNIFRNEINTHCQLFATHYRSSPGNFLVSVKKNWESDFKSLEIINIVYVRLLNCKLLHKSIFCVSV